MTLKEFLIDYASEDTRRIGEEMIEKEIGNIPKEKVREIVRERLGLIEQGNRDFRF
jgi:2-iminoacetate synthase